MYVPSANSEYPCVKFRDGSCQEVTAVSASQFRTMQKNVGRKSTNVIFQSAYGDKTLRVIKKVDWSLLVAIMVYGAQKYKRQLCMTTVSTWGSDEVRD